MKLMLLWIASPTARKDEITHILSLRGIFSPKQSKKMQLFGEKSYKVDAFMGFFAYGS